MRRIKQAHERAASRDSSREASGDAANEIPRRPETKNAPRGAALAIDSNLWQRAMETLPDKDRQWIQERSAASSSGLPENGQVDKLIGLVGRLQRRREERKWRRAEEPFRASLACLHKFKEIGDIVTQYDPAHLALPWAGVRFILSSALSYREHMAMAASSIEATTRVVHRYRIYQLLYGPGTVSSDAREMLEAALVDLYASVWRLLLRVGRFLGKDTTRRSVHAIFHSEDMESLLADVGRLEVEAEKAVVVCKATQDLQSDKELLGIARRLESLLPLQESVKQVQESLERMDRGVLEVLEKMEDMERIRLLEWVSPVKYGFHHQFVREQRTAGTCRWILEEPEYREWLSQTSSVTLWLHAPGTPIKPKYLCLVYSLLSSRQGQNLPHLNGRRFHSSHAKGGQESGGLRLFLLQLR